MPVYQKIKHELTKERHNEFIDGFLDLPACIVYSYLGNEKKASLRDRGIREHEKASLGSLYSIGDMMSTPVSILLLIPAAGIITYRMTKMEPEIPVYCFDK